MAPACIMALNWAAVSAGTAVLAPDPIIPTPGPGKDGRENHESPKTDAGEFA